jgi:hypothetical protein
LGKVVVQLWSQLREKCKEDHIWGSPRKKSETLPEK